jgi:hypothetical protein
MYPIQGLNLRIILLKYELDDLRNKDREHLTFTISNCTALLYFVGKSGYSCSLSR